MFVLQTLVDSARGRCYNSVMRTDFGILTHNVVSMRGAPVSNSEQVSQALFGEVVTWLEERDGYVLVETEDAYRGWVWRKHLRPYMPGPSGARFPFDEYPADAYSVTSLFADAKAVRGINPVGVYLETKLVFGTVGRVDRDEQIEDGCVLLAIPYGSEWIELSSQMVMVSVPADSVTRLSERKKDAAGDTVSIFDGEAACQLARRFLGVPYLWGGGTPFGFDCSGFVQRIYKTFGIVLPRDAHLQAASPLGQYTAENEQENTPSKPVIAGDLVFFSGQQDPLKRGITHVGMALNANCFIHAVGKDGVVITHFDAPEHRSQYVYRGAWRYGEG